MKSVKLQELIWIELKHRTSFEKVNWLMLISLYIKAAVAQLVEHTPVKRAVVGSNPTNGVHKLDFFKQFGILGFYVMAPEN
jgi:hypothetical protein